MISTQWDFLFVRGTSRPGTSQSHEAVLFSCPSHNQYWASDFGLESSPHLNTAGFLLVILSFGLLVWWYRIPLGLHQKEKASQDTEMADTGRCGALEGWRPHSIFLLDLRINSRCNTAVLRMCSPVSYACPSVCSLDTHPQLGNQEFLLGFNSLPLAHWSSPPI